MLGQRPARLGTLTRAAVLAAACCAAGTASWAFRTSRAAGQAAQAPFASLIEQLSEPSGEFDTDNLISNEQSYLHVLPALELARASAEFRQTGSGPSQRYRARFWTRDASRLRDLFEIVGPSHDTEVLIDDRPLPYARELWLPLLYFLIYEQ